MGLKFSSIKFQILLAFSFLAVPVLLLAYFIFASHDLFSNTLNNTFNRETVLSLTSNLQRDVINLQRNVLIYKNNASDGSLRNVEMLYQDISQKLNTLSDTQSLDAYDDTGALNSMERHLKDYKVNFDLVVIYREQREKMVQEHLSDNFNTTIATLERADGSLENSEEINPTIASIKNKLYSASNYSLAYLATNDHLYIDGFKDAIKQCLQATEQLSNHSTRKENITAALQNYDQEFMYVVNLTRNYIYLINVVMAGSAQEILYYGNYLTDRVVAATKADQTSVLADISQRRTIVILACTFGLAVAIFVPIYFFRLITKPIEQITRIFNDLASGKSVQSIPGHTRDDEIGLLAAAANVFRAKNEQTTHLLEQAEHFLTIQQKLNSDLNDAKTKAEKALSVKTDFLANMSHELRTPLNSVIGYTVRLLKKPENFNERQLMALDAIERNGRHLLAMINDVLDLSKIDANKLEINVQRINITTLCRDVLEQMHAYNHEKQLQLIFDTNTPSCFVETDPVRMTQILNNLLSNAIKYTDDGWVKLDLNINEAQKHVVINVSDSGTGIQEADLGRLFQRFEQLNQEHNVKIGQGTGLGLSIVAKLSQLLRAKISVTSEYGIGSCFSVILPFKQPETPYPEDNNFLTA
ncbi:ATP-binding protein [Marinibactrum halimedae]|uniref:histidine kinase n=1 Tax=Marinibactrum halimedae TaxID=1444977 RepID=A0AA37T0F0_9GAMM|nr:ATP-binding protein [Marinibactrum halimedae]MCD9461110.1 ATP-binding protein [Marinibactrum halimedae]GLS24450.1 hypothetical protein GCM10007877_01610 [Marinibactrum halimedae]